MSQTNKESKLLAVVRLRGSVDQTKEVKYTLNLLNLTRPNHAVVVPNDTTHQGMIQRVKDAVTWGEIDKKTLTELVKKRGRIKGNKEITASFLKEHKFSTVASFISDLYEGKTDMRRIEGMKPIFRLHPPRKGFKSVKNPVTRGGDLGYRGEKINDLLMKMM
jgi:large subunit ribosomal protein L30